MPRFFVFGRRTPHRRNAGGLARTARPLRGGPCPLPLKPSQLSMNYRWMPRSWTSKLRDGAAYPVAQKLRQRRVPFLFATACEKSGIAAEIRPRKLGVQAVSNSSCCAKNWMMPSRAGRANRPQAAKARALPAQARETAPPAGRTGLIGFSGANLSVSTRTRAGTRPKNSCGVGIPDLICDGRDLEAGQQQLLRFFHAPDCQVFEWRKSGRRPERARHGPDILTQFTGKLIHAHVRPEAAFDELRARAPTAVCPSRRSDVRLSATPSSGRSCESASLWRASTPREQRAGFLVVFHKELLARQWGGLGCRCVRDRCALLTMAIGMFTLVAASRANG